MKKILYFSIVAILLYANVGYIVGYFVTLSSIKKERLHFIEKTKNYLDCTKFTLIEETQRELHFEFWHPDEFEYKGKMYDIISRVEENGVKIIYALVDNKESNFLDKFKEFMNNKIDGKTLVIHFFKFISNLDDVQVSGNFQFYLNEANSQIFVKNNLIIIQNYFLEILKPPPNKL